MLKGVTFSKLNTREINETGEGRAKEVNVSLLLSEWQFAGLAIGGCIMQASNPAVKMAASEAEWHSAGAALGQQMGPSPLNSTG